MNILDGIIVVAAVAYGIGGFRSGALIGIFSLVGFFGGAVVGGQVARPLGERVADGRAQVPVAIVCVLLLATVGQLLGVWIAGRLRDRIVRPRLRPLDATIGGALGVVSVLLVAWMIAVPLASSPYPSLATEATQSKIVRGVNDVVPGSFRNVYSSLRVFFDRSGFPPVFGDLPSTSIVAVGPPPDLSQAVQREVARVQRSTFKVYGEAPECSRAIEGSSFVYARHYLLTNAHVVAGTQQVSVETADGPVRATVVLFDPQRDVAVLYAPGLDAPALSFAGGTAAAGSPAVVLGYPENGPFTVRSARVRSEGTVSGRDIYNQATVDRSIYSIRAVVRSGNSGGPLIDDAGKVLGIVFATALDSPDTGFALTDTEVAGDASTGRGRSAAVSTQGCTQD